MYKVKYIVLATGAVIEKEFRELYHCRVFLNKIKHSKKCRVISCPIV